MLKVRELSREDANIINTWRADKELISNLGAPFRYINQEVDEAWFENYMKNRSNTVRCVTFDSSKPKVPLCSTTLADIDWINRSAQLHIMIGSKTKRYQGIGSFSISEMINHAFLDLNLRRIELEVLENNKKAIKFYTKHHFIQEGTKKQSIYKDGKYLDTIIMAIVKEEVK